MKGCNDLAVALYGLVAGEIPADECKGLEEHVCCCPRCAALVQSYQITITLVRRLPPVPMPPEALERLRQRLAEAPPGP
jgi:anti-sigma factor RsiW